MENLHSKTDMQHHDVRHATKSVCNTVASESQEQFNSAAFEHRSIDRRPFLASRMRQVSLDIICFCLIPKHNIIKLSYDRK